ncbi:hypothetical protein NPIL_474581 [Nephila pilipes]|uniref:Uncharacterized protein n=1 Tax=Nephila pilipes TaxID=299642 RepID=A0A8X6UJ00_NEPPI|nr:hypothetical protein NPIL_474581 [Nephila pilipes]
MMNKKSRSGRRKYSIDLIAVMDCIAPSSKLRTLCYSVNGIIQQLIGFFLGTVDCVLEFFVLGFSLQNSIGPSYSEIVDRHRSSNLYNLSSLP